MPMRMPLLLAIVTFFATNLAWAKEDSAEARQKQRLCEWQLAGKAEQISLNPIREVIWEYAFAETPDLRKELRSKLADLLRRRMDPKSDPDAGLKVLPPSREQSLAGYIDDVYRDPAIELRKREITSVLKAYFHLPLAQPRYREAVRVNYDLANAVHARFDLKPYIKKYPDRRAEFDAKNVKLAKAEEILKTVYFVSMEESVERSAIPPDKLAQLKSNSRGLMHIKTYLQQPVLKDNIALGLDWDEYKTIAGAFMIENFFDTYDRYEIDWHTDKQHTEHFLDRLAQEGKPVVMFVPDDAWNHPLGITHKELQYLLAHPEKMANILFVFGAYNLALNDLSDFGDVAHPGSLKEAILGETLKEFRRSLNLRD